MESVLVLLRVLCVVFFCAVAVRACGTNNAVCEEARRTLVDSACEIRGNELVLADYYSGVRARHSEFGRFVCTTSRDFFVQCDDLSLALSVYVHLYTIPHGGGGSFCVLAVLPMVVKRCCICCFT